MHQHAGDEHGGREDAEATRQEPDADAAEHGAGEHQRQAVTDPQWMPVEVRVPRQGRRGGQRKDDQARARDRTNAIAIRTAETYAGQINIHPDSWYAPMRTWRHASQP